MADIVTHVSDLLKGIYSSLPAILPQVKEVERIIIKEVQMLRPPPESRVFIRIAGISGALAVILGAYGAHVLRDKNVDEKLKDVFAIANRYHFIHTLALLAVPFTRKPVLTGTLLISGLSLFCGSCYAHALTANTSLRQITPYGGVILIFGWASMAL